MRGLAAGMLSRRMLHEPDVVIGLPINRSGKPSYDALSFGPAHVRSSITFMWHHQRLWAADKRFPPFPFAVPACARSTRHGLSRLCALTVTGRKSSTCPGTSLPALPPDVRNDAFPCGNRPDAQTISPRMSGARPGTGGGHKRWRRWAERGEKCFTCMEHSPLRNSCSTPSRTQDATGADGGSRFMRPEGSGMMRQTDTPSAPSVRDGGGRRIGIPSGTAWHHRLIGRIPAKRRLHTRRSVRVGILAAQPPRRKLR